MIVYIQVCAETLILQYFLIFRCTLIYLRKFIVWTKNKHWVYSLSFITILSILLEKLSMS